MQKFPEDWSWESLPNIYRSSPFLTLDMATASDDRFADSGLFTCFVSFLILDITMRCFILNDNFFSQLLLIL